MTTILVTTCRVQQLTQRKTHFIRQLYHLVDCNTLGTIATYYYSLTDTLLNSQTLSVTRWYTLAIHSQNFTHYNNFINYMTSPSSNGYGFSLRLGRLIRK